MTVRTRYVVLFTPKADEPEVPSVEGVFLSMETALACVNDLHMNEGFNLEGFEVEGWRGRQFHGVWNAAGQLIEDRLGRERIAPAEVK